MILQIWLAAPTILAHEHVFAAIAQPVERILGKDEVASSNLASSSKTLDSLRESRVFLISEAKSRPHSFTPLNRKGSSLL